MIIATVWKLGFHLPNFNLQAFHPKYLNFTFGGYARILALMTGIEIFANLVAAYEGPAEAKSRKAFGSLLIIMGTTAATMLIVGPAILQLSDPIHSEVSVFTQTMDKLLPSPLPYVGTLIGIIVLASASAASAQGLQNLALGLRYRNYIPATLGTRNKYDVADKPVWLEVALVAFCYLLLGTNEDTYLALYAAGVFILLSMTGWAAAKRLRRELRTEWSTHHAAALVGTIISALLTSAATFIIFAERLREGAWMYFLFVPILYFVFTYFRSKQGEPKALDEHLGKFLCGQYLLPSDRAEKPEDEPRLERIIVPLDGTAFAEHSLPMAETLAHVFQSRLTLVTVDHADDEDAMRGLQDYMNHLAWQLENSKVPVELVYRSGMVAEEINNLAAASAADLIVMSTHGMPGLDRLYVGDIANKLIRILKRPLLLLRPTERWQTRTSRFKRLLVTLDGSEFAETVLRYARFLADTFGSEIVLLSVPEADAEQETIQNYLETVASALRDRGYNVRALVTGSGAVRSILAVSLSEEADLIMMSTHGRGSVERRPSVGSVADRVVDGANCPVFLVPA
jgi:nucleotide-binding universal stress UspA family protein